ncbi:MAG: hypothetical protein GY906_35385 [bacterium]|nr:hypothetical protein [bacterium]
MENGAIGGACLALVSRSQNRLGLVCLALSRNRAWQRSGGTMGALVVWVTLALGLGSMVLGIGTDGGARK